MAFIRISIFFPLQNPDVGLLFSTRRVIQVVALYYVGLLPFVPLRETHFEVPMPGCLYNFTPNPSLKDKLMIFAMDKFLMRRGLFQHLQKRGIPVSYLLKIKKKESIFLVITINCCNFGFAGVSVGAERAARVGQSFRRPRSRRGDDRFSVQADGVLEAKGRSGSGV